MQTFSREYEKCDPRIRTTIDRLNGVGLSCVLDKSRRDTGPVKIDVISSYFNKKQFGLLKHLNFKEVKD